jgi:hypothetical protein
LTATSGNFNCRWDIQRCSKFASLSKICSPVSEINACAQNPSTPFISESTRLTPKIFVRIDSTSNDEPLTKFKENRIGVTQARNERIFGQTVPCVCKTMGISALSGKLDVDTAQTHRLARFQVDRAKRSRDNRVGSFDFPRISRKRVEIGQPDGV